MSGDATDKPESGDVELVDGEVCTSPALVDGEVCASPAELVGLEDDTADIITEAVAATWKEAVHQLGGPPSNPLPLWTMMAARILDAVKNGERDPQGLKFFALVGLKRYGVSPK